MNINLLALIFDGSKHVEKSSLKFLFYSNAIVNHRDPQNLLRDIFDQEENLPVTICEFQGVAHKVQDNLLKALFVRLQNV
jgi:hypothetical protein